MCRQQREDVRSYFAIHGIKVKHKDPIGQFFNIVERMGKGKRFEAFKIFSEIQHLDACILDLHDSAKILDHDIFKLQRGSYIEAHSEEEDRNGISTDFEC